MNVAEIILLKTWIRLHYLLAWCICQPQRKEYQFTRLYQKMHCASDLISIPRLALSILRDANFLHGVERFVYFISNSYCSSPKIRSADPGIDRLCRSSQITMDSCHYWKSMFACWIMNWLYPLWKLADFSETFFYKIWRKAFILYSYNVPLFLQCLNAHTKEHITSYRIVTTILSFNLILLVTNHLLIILSTLLVWNSLEEFTTYT